MNYNFVTLECLISLGILAFIWFRLFGRLRRDNFRSRIRRLRDGLFDFMWKNGFDFSTPAYRETRQMLNGMLRLSNVFSPVSFLVGIFFAALHEASFGKKADALSYLPNGPLKQEIQRIHCEAVRDLITFVYLEGIFGVFVRMLLPLLAIVKLAFRAKEWTIRAAERFISTVVYGVGSQDFSHAG